jgi:hypothetical protein
MSRVRSDKFTNRAATGPCTFTDGLTVTDTTGASIGVEIGMGGIVAVAGTFSGNVSVAGTLTYDDVTNIDSVGVVTAGKGLRVTTEGIVVTAGVSTFGGAIDAPTLDTNGSGVVVTGIATADQLVGRHGNIVPVTKSTSYTLASGDEGKMVITDSEVIVPENIFVAGDVFTVVNSSGSSINITKGTGINLYTVGSSTNATVALAEKGVAVITCFSGNDFIVGGGGVS